MGDLPTLLGALVAVAGLILVCRVAGFRRPAGLPGIEQVAHLLAVLPYGFEAVRSAIDQRNRCALAIDRGGRVAVVAPAGSHYFARLADQSWTCANKDGLLEVTGSDFSLVLDLDGEAAEWQQAIARAAGRS